MKNKKAISAVVAVVLIILITVVAISIVWGQVIPMVNRVSQLNEGCLNAQLKIDTMKGYTCYDEENKELNVMVSRGAENFDLTGIQVGIINSEGMMESVVGRSSPDRDGVRILVIEERGSSWRGRLEELGYEVIFSDILTIEKINIQDPDIVACFKSYLSCSKYSLLNEAYEAGYSIFSEGNDNGNTTWNKLLPIYSSEWINVNVTKIYPDTVTNNSISRGWSSANGSGTDGRQGITGIHPNAEVVAIDTVNNFTEAIYLEEEGKGKWFHYQPSRLAPDEVLTNAVEQLVVNGTARVYLERGFNMTLPESNGASTFKVYLDVLDISDAQHVTIAPIIRVGATEKICEVSSETRVSMCS